MASAGFWIETVKDLATSVPREWHREVCREDNSIDYTGLADAIMCSLVVGTLLLGWGLAGRMLRTGNRRSGRKWHSPGLVGRIAFHYCDARHRCPGGGPGANLLQLAAE